MDNLALTRGAMLALTSGALAAGTGAGTVKTTATVTYVIDGQFYSKAATDNLALTAPLGEGQQLVQPLAGIFDSHKAGTVRLYGLFLDTAGNFFVTQGAPAVTTDLAAGVVPLQWPEAPRAYGDSITTTGAGPKSVCVGCIRVSLTSGAVFNIGTDLLTTAGNRTVTFYNLAAIPAEPLRS